ncbi:protein translocase subunit SecD [Amedibacillus dolichus]|uniref:Multifunctional fusion protein n=1 Tax=Amedibacillus dolichus TaxID=31971 RepID=A0ABT7U9S6_9FIRM|nr:protein translocase subunit SecD [Amedibacillus dolichus]MDM8156386.1 protein translocase subunit SecD [Amedibacillus dolichus]
MKKSRLAAFGIIVATIIAVIIAFASDIRNSMTLGLDLQGGFEILYQVTPLEGQEMPDMEAVVSSVRKRVDVLGVSEPEITVEGNDRIRVSLAGVDSPDQARRIISSTANLTFRDVNDNLLMDASVLEEGGASVGQDQYGNYVVNLSLKDSDTFYQVTSEIAQRSSGQNLIVAWLDYEEGQSYAAESRKEDPAYISAATVSEGISGNSAQISGNFTPESATELKDLINSGSLPVQLTEQYSDVVSADYGLGAFSTTMLAGAIGVAAVMLFMICVYRLPGVISAITLAVYIFVVFLLYNAMGAVFTLSGIAALVLGVGMAVDSNILTFERIKDAMYHGRSVQSAFREGSRESFRTILDAQMTTLISAIILYLLGTGSVKGFATMLIVSTLTTLLLIVFVARFLLGLLVKSGCLDNRYELFSVRKNDVPDVSKNEERRKFPIFRKFDFVGKAKYFIFTSLAVIVVAAGCMVYHGVNGEGIMNFGIDFSSGTSLIVQSDSTIDSDALTQQLADLGIEVDSIRLGGSENTTANVYIKEAIDSEQLSQVKTTLQETYGHEVNDNIVTPVIGRELVRNAVIISLLAWIGILIYVSIRFKWDYALSGIVALIHDVIIILAFCAILRLEINTEIVAVLLTIIGYSINNSIVVFDRIRENVRKTRGHLDKDGYRTLVNEALATTCTRSVFSTLTTMLPVIALLLFGSDGISVFNLTLLIGLIAGAGSSMFIAAQLWYYLRLHKKPKKAKKKKKQTGKKELDEMTIPGIND